MSKITKVLCRVLPALAIVSMLAACASSERHVSSASGYDQANSADEVDDGVDHGISAKYTDPKMRQY